MNTDPTLPACPAAILRRPTPVADPLELEPEEPTVIIEPDKMTPDVRALFAEARRLLGYGSCSSHNPW